MSFAFAFSLFFAGAPRSSAKTASFGSTLPLRVIHYVEPGAPYDAADRRAILDGENVLARFYEGYGLHVVFEPDVREFRGSRRAFGPGGPEKAYWTVHDELKAAGLLLRGRTIVFAPFDVGLTGDMALVRINSAGVAARECPRRYDGERTWWCGRPPGALWGGLLHETGHLFGLKHFSKGDREARFSVMGDFKAYPADPEVGLTRSEISILKRRFGQGEKKR